MQVRTKFLSSDFKSRTKASTASCWYYYHKFQGKCKKGGTFWKNSKRQNYSGGDAQKMNMVFRTSFALFGLPIAPFKKGSFFKKKMLQTNLYCWLSDSWLPEDFILQGKQRGTEGSLECDFPSWVLTTSAFWVNSSRWSERVASGILCRVRFEIKQPYFQQLRVFVISGKTLSRGGEQTVL